MTVGDLRTRMTTREFLSWHAYYELQAEERTQDAAMAAQLDQHHGRG